MAVGGATRAERDGQPKSAAQHNRTRERIISSGVALCGDFGGMKAGDVPCTHEAGWGTATPGTGRCKEHDDLAKARDEKIKREFLRIYGENQPITMRKACVDAGSTIVTVWRMRRADPDFDKAVKELMAYVNDARVSLVEDATYIRAADPTNNADMLRMYILNNKRSDEFKDRRRIEHTGKDGKPIEQNVTTRAKRPVWKVGGRDLPFGDVAPDAAKKN